MQSIALVTQENIYQDCLKQLGWTTNIKEAFPNHDLILEKPTKPSDSIKETFYTAKKRNTKIKLSIAVAHLNLQDLVFVNGGNTYTLNVLSFNNALKNEISEHFKSMVNQSLASEADITAYPATSFSVNTTDKTYRGTLYIVFKNKIGQTVQSVRYDTFGKVETEDMRLDARSKLITEKALTELIRSVGWLMNQQDFRKEFANITPES